MLNHFRSNWQQRGAWSTRSETRRERWEWRKNIKGLGVNLLKGTGGKEAKGHDILNFSPKALKMPLFLLFYSPPPINEN